MTLLFKDSFDSGPTPTGFNGESSAWGSTGGSSTTGRHAGGQHIDSAAHFSKTLTSGNRHVTLIAGIAIGGTSPTDDNDPDDLGILSFWGDAGATCHIFISDIHDPTQPIKVYRGNPNTGGAVLLASSAAAVNTFWTSASYHYLEAKVFLDDTTGAVDVKVDGTTVVSFTGDTKNGGTATVLDTLKFGGFFPNNANVDDLYLLNGAGSAPYNDFLGDPGDVSTLGGTGSTSSGSLTLGGSVGGSARGSTTGSLTLGGAVTMPLSVHGSLTFGGVALARPVYLASFTVDVGMEASDIPLLPADTPTADYVGNDASDLVDYPDPALDSWGRPIAS